MKQLSLGELIEILESHDPETMCFNGFGAADSYRGYYEQLAFEPAGETSFGKMLSYAKFALNSTYTGWKGGEFLMTKDTLVNIANPGECGYPITESTLEVSHE